MWAVQLTLLRMNSALLRKSVHFLQLLTRKCEAACGSDRGPNLNIWNGAVMKELLVHMLISHSLRKQNHLDFRALV